MTSEQSTPIFPKPNTYYVLINLQSGTAMDLSGADWRSVIGWPPHVDLSSRSTTTGPSLNDNLVEPEPNQQWEFEPIGAGWGLRCVFTKDSWMHLPGQGGSTSREKKMYLKYLVPSTDKGLRHESPLLASGFPVVWDVEKVNWAGEGKADGKKEKHKEDVVVKIRLPRSDGDSKDQLVVDLSNWGSNRGGTKVQLARELNPTHPCQLWRLVECGRRPSPAPAPTPALAPGTPNQTNETSKNPSTREEKDIVKADDTTTTGHGSTSISEPNPNTSTSTSASTSTSTSTTTATSTSSPTPVQTPSNVVVAQDSTRSAQSLKKVKREKQKRNLPKLQYMICEMCRRVTTSSADGACEDEGEEGATDLKEEEFVSAATTPQILASSLRMAIEEEGEGIGGYGAGGSRRGHERHGHGHGDEHGDREEGRGNTSHGSVMEWDLMSDDANEHSDDSGGNDNDDDDDDDDESSVTSSSDSGSDLDPHEHESRSEDPVNATSVRDERKESTEMGEVVKVEERMGKKEQEGQTHQETSVVPDSEGEVQTAAGLPVRVGVDKDGEVTVTTTTTSVTTTTTVTTVTTTRVGRGATPGV